MKKTEAIQHFLSTVSNRHLTKLYNPNMEVQVNVSQNGGKRVGGNYLGKRWMGWSDGNTTWKSFRIPWNAKTIPEYVDTELKFDLSSYVEGIGLTGWDWVNKQSLWVGYDFDSIANHKQGLSNETITAVKENLYELPYTNIVKSTSGKGLHLYIHLDNPITTNNHTEHAALARSILSILSMDCGFNFHNTVDACGMVLWVYHKKQENTDGLTMIKEGDKFPSDRVTHWEDHIVVTAGKRKKIHCVGGEESLFDELVSSIKKYDLSVEHREVLNWFKVNTSPDKDSWWDSDNNMLVCHTHDLKRCHSDLHLKGIFHTSSSGSSRQNCYAFPSETGSWIIRRHTPGVQEHPSWVVDPSGWTRCVYNTLADLATCARSNNGIENSKGEFVFPTAKKGLQSLYDAGIKNVSIEDIFLNRNMFIREKNDGTLIIAFQREAHDQYADGFLSNNKGDKWEKVIHRQKPKKDLQAPDYLIRHVIAGDVEAGWWIYARKKWIQQTRTNVVTVLLAQNSVANRNDIELMMSKAILNPWELVNIPFEVEYPGDRKWNRGAAAFSCMPEEGACSTWLDIIDHCGKNLDSAVSEDSWCIENAINDGKEYLLFWIASMLQKPSEPLPYLFFVGPQNCGKSTLHEALSKLMIRGYARADNALINQQGFNAEICNAVLCVVEETNLSKNKDASNRIKDWVTGKTISINTKHKTVYDIDNTTHWIQCANDVNYCPVFQGDTRIVICRVDMPKREIPKTELFNMLEKEKNAFLHLILNIELPEAPGRLGIPCIHTAEKRDIERFNASALALFINEEVELCKGKLVPFEDFYHRFIQWISPEERDYWTKMRVSKELPKEYPWVKGKSGGDNITYLGNVTFNFDDKAEVYEYYLDTKHRLQRRMYHD